MEQIVSQWDTLAPLAHRAAEAGWRIVIILVIVIVTVDPIILTEVVDKMAKNQMATQLVTAKQQKTKVTSLQFFLTNLTQRRESGCSNLIYLTQTLPIETARLAGAVDALPHLGIMPSHLYVISLIFYV